MTSKKRSFRIELLCTVLLSLFFAAITEGAIIFVFFLLCKLTGQGMSADIAKSHTEELPDFSKSFEFRNQMSGDYHFRFSKEYISKSYVAIMILILLVGVILFLLYFMTLTKKYSRYLNDLTSGILEISIGNFNHKIPVENNGELCMVGEKLNEMSNYIYLFLCDEHQNESVKNELITSVAHDIRTPLTSIIGYLYLAVYRKDLKEEVRNRYIQIAYNKSKRLEQLTEDLFSYTKYSNDEVKLHYERIDLVKFMEQLIDEFYPSFKDAELNYSLECELPKAYIMADGNTLARAMGNLVGNAIKYGRDGKSIKVVLKQEDQYVSVAVINYGEIIPKEDLKHIFERFYRVENSRSNETGGSGLGLAIAKRIVEMHNGTIMAKSDLEGTVFEVKLRLLNSEEEGLCESPE